MILQQAKRSEVREAWAPKGLETQATMEKTKPELGRDEKVVSGGVCEENSKEVNLVIGPFQFYSLSS